MNKFSPYIRTLRPYQWIKNILVFSPAVASHELFHTDKLFASSLAFLSFSLAASAVYIFNDIADIKHDRTDPLKSNRPIAKGDIKAQGASILGVILLVLSLALSTLLPKSFLVITCLYFISCMLYTAFFKKILILDLLILAGLYLMRIFAGGCAAGIAISEWFLAFSLFLFFSLAVLKRYLELKSNQDRDRLAGRPYRKEDSDFLYMTGFISGFISILVFVLYINSPKVSGLYSHQSLLWLIIPILTYWVSMVWIKANRCQIKVDLLRFIVVDPSSWISITLVLLTMFFAI